MSKENIHVDEIKSDNFDFKSLKDKSVDQSPN